MDSRADHLVRRLRLRHLELLVALAEAGTMRAAAGRLHLSQPAISKMLVEAEDALGARLFDRTRQGVQATAAGHAAVRRARVALGELAHACDEVGALHKGVSAVLRVGTFSVTAAVPAAVVQLRRRLPGAAVRLHEGRVRELIQLLLEGELDCVFGALTPELLDDDLLRALQSELLLEREVAGRDMARRQLAQQRRLGLAQRLRARAARVEVAAAGRVDRAGHVAFEHDALARHRRVGDRHRRQQRLGVGMLAARCTARATAPLRRCAPGTSPPRGG